MEKRGIARWEHLAQKQPRMKGVTLRQQIRRAREKGTPIPTTSLEICAGKLGVPIAWLAFGDGPDPFDDLAPVVPPAPPMDLTVDFAGETFAAIPRWDMQLSAGHGRTAPGSPEVLHPTLFRLSWLQSVTRSPLDALAVVEIDGDSMEPTLRTGDVVLVDQLQNRPRRRDGLYALNRDGDLQVKRVSVHPQTGLFTIGSDNSTYPTHPNIPPNAVEVIGRVIWIGRRT